MTKRLVLFGASMAVLLLLASCASAPPYEGPVKMVGTWGYTVTDTNGNTYDHGTIRFDGEAPSGSWTMKNAYDIEYAGTWTLGGTALTLAGDEAWSGKATGPDRFTGTWRHDNGDSGTWEALRR
jgi:hypothetical protein